MILYVPKNRNANKEQWDKIQEFYPKMKMFFYEDKGVQQHLGLYIPILRPHCLWQHFEAFPELRDEIIIYTDCDILWTKPIDFSNLYEGDCSYVSDAKSYLNVSYFESKVRDVKPDKLEEYKQRDIVKELCDIVGIDKSVAIENNNNTGGVQYVLKNVDSFFWKKVERDVLSIRRHLLQVNKEFFESENKGIQSWCADLWAIQYNLWLKGCCKVTDDLSFLWCHDSAERLKTTNIYHNAGATNEGTEEFPVFYKGKYHTGTNPFTDPHLDKMLNNETSMKHCTGYYVKKLDELRKKYDITYL